MNSLNDSCEPMDIDISSSSASKMDISIDDDLADYEIVDRDTKPDISKLNAELLMQRIVTPLNMSFQGPNLQDSNVLLQVQNKDSKISRNSFHLQYQKEKANEKCTKYYNTHLKWLLLAFFVVWVSSLTYINNISSHCVEELDMKNVQGLFERNLFGQSEAASKLIAALETEATNKILFLYGGTGVGKTFATSLILDTLWNSSNIYHYTMPSFVNKFSTELMLGLIMCKTTIMVVDDLTIKDIKHIILHIKNVIDKSENLGKHLLIILIFNCDAVSDNFVKKCDNSFATELNQSFSDIKTVKEFIKFEQLTEEHLRKCIECELGTWKPASFIDNIIKNFNVTLDGCKGVHSKMKLLNIG